MIKQESKPVLTKYFRHENITIILLGESISYMVFPVIILIKKGELELV